MLDALRQYLSEDNFMPHGMCYLWQPGVLWLHVVSDALIFLAYSSIPFTLLYFVRHRRDLQFHWMFICFAVFIVACGATHLMEIWVIWHPDYWLSGGIKAITALASVPTAVLLVRLVPQALALPSPGRLKEANAELQREIAERKRAESEVRRMNDELESRVAERTRELEIAKAIIDNSTAIVYVKDVDGRYLLINRRFEELFHETRHSIAGKTDYDLFPKETADAFRAADEWVRSAGRAMQLEEVAPHEDGPHAYVSTKCPLYDTEGRIHAICGISTDITELKRSERRQRQQLSQLELLNRITRAIEERQDLLSILQVVIRSLEEDLPIDFGCALLYEPADRTLKVAQVGARSALLGAELRLAESARLSVDQNGLARCVRGHVVYEPDVSRTGFPFTQSLSRVGLRSVVLAPLMAAGNTVGVLVAARRAQDAFSSGDCEFLRQLADHVALAANQARLYGDLQRAYDDLRQTQISVMQQERLRALGQMASGIAHDINNALSPAALYAQSLLERELTLSVRSREHLEIIQRAIEDVGNTVGRLREFYRGRDPAFVPTQLQFNRILAQVVNLTRARWLDMPQERGVVIQVETSVDPNLPPTTGSESDIRDALTNLVLNAADAMPDGGTLSLRVGQETRANGAPTHVRVEVSDTGLGMDEETRRRCLEPFFTTKGERGSGLGLAMVYGAIQRHGGEIDIHSVPLRGTTVSLLFPIAHPFQETHDMPRSVPGPLRDLRILVVDDDPLLLRSMRDTLEEDGHDVDVADGGQAGIDAFKEAKQRGEPYAVVLTDLGMPYVDGRKVAAAVKAVSPTTPVILVTGWGQRMHAESDFPACIDRVLSKPPRLAELRRTLAELTADSQAPAVPPAAHQPEHSNHPHAGALVDPSPS